jgi:hypothetical protein
MFSPHISVVISDEVRVENARRLIGVRITNVRQVPLLDEWES